MTGSIPDRLTEAQRECLRLVLTHHSSKEIAAILKLSPSAVDKRLERAVQVLGSTSRFEAARRLAVEEGLLPYEPLPYEPSDVPLPPVAGSSGARAGQFGLGLRLIGLGPDAGPDGNVRNPLTTPQRLMVIAGLIVALAVSILVFVAVGATLSDLVSRGRAETTVKR